MMQSEAGSKMQRKIFFGGFALSITLAFVIFTPELEPMSYLEAGAALYVCFHLLYVVFFARDTQVPGTQITVDSSPHLRVIIVCVAVAVAIRVFQWGMQGWP